VAITRSKTILWDRTVLRGQDPSGSGRFGVIDAKASRSYGITILRDHWWRV